LSAADRQCGRADGRELFYVRARRAGAAGGEDEELIAHAVATDGSISPKAQPLFHLAPIRAAATMPVPGYDVTADGRFLFVQQPDTPPPLPNRIHIVENWFEEAKAKVPVKR
jgi:hypothetical protein